MSIESLLLLLLVGAVAGWLATAIMGEWGFGLLFNIIIGIVGGVLGAWLLPLVGISTGNGIISAILVATVGAVVILAVLVVFQRVGFVPRRRMR